MAKLFKREDLLAVTEDDAPEGFKLIEEGDWVQDGKYQYCEFIFEFEGKTYVITDSRTGSYHTEWYYQSECWPAEVEAYEVEKVEKITHEWRTK